MNHGPYVRVFKQNSERNWRFFFVIMRNELAINNYRVVSIVQKEEIKCTELIKLKLSSVLYYVTILSLVWCHPAFKWPSV